MTFLQLRRINQKFFILSVFILLDFFCPNAFGQDTNDPSMKGNDQEVLIESDSQSTDSMGNVFSAYGNVRIIYPKKGIVTSSRQAQYLRKEQIIVLTGDVELIRNKQESLKGERVIYSLKDDQLVADSHPESQVLLKLFIQPAQSMQAQPTL